MRWWAQTHGPKLELVRHFLAHMFDGEWSSGKGQWQTVATGALSMLLPAGMLMMRSGSPVPEFANQFRILSRLSSPEPFRNAVLGDEIAFLTLVMAFTGVVTLLVWQSLFPSRRDALALAGMPVTPRQLFLARFATILSFAVILVAAVNLLPAFLAPLEMSGRWQRNPSFWANAGAQAASACAGCLAVFFAIVALQGLLLNLLPARLFARLSVLAQGGLVAVMLLACLRSWSIQSWTPATLARIPEFGGWLPPVWFAGLHEYLLGAREPFLAAMAGRAAWTAALGVALSAATYLAAYRHYRKLLIEGPVPVVGRARQWSYLRLLTRDPRQEGVMQFMAKTLARSRTHRLIWLAYAGGALAVVLNSSVVDGALLARDHEWTKALEFLVLFWPLACTMVLLKGAHHVLRIPAELRANWIFQSTESLGRAEWMKAVERFIIAYAIAPVYLLLGPIAAWVLGWPLALRMTVLQVLVSLSFFEMIFYSWQQLPFACSYRPGQKTLVMIAAAWLAQLGVVVPLLSVIVAAGSRFNGLFAFFFLLFASAWWFLRRRRREGWGESPLLYEDNQELAPDLGIRELSFGQGRVGLLACPARTRLGAWEA